MLFLSPTKATCRICTLDSKNLVTVGIGTCLRTVDDAQELRFYQRGTSQVATDAEIATDYSAVLKAKPDPVTNPNGFSWRHYKKFTKLDMTPTDIGNRWLADVKSFQAQLPAHFAGFAAYPVAAKQALTDIAYQYGASGAAGAAAGKLREAAQKADWTAAAALCPGLEGQPDRNAARKALFERAAQAGTAPTAPTSATPTSAASQASKPSGSPSP